MAGKKSDTTDVAALKRELEAANADRAALQGRLNQESNARRQAEQANMSAQERALVADQEATESNIDALNGEIQSYEDQIAALADEPGHGKEIAALTRKTAAAAAKLETAENKKVYLAAQRERMKGANERRAQADETPAGDTKLPNGALLSGFTPKTQAWLKEHPEAITNQAYFSRVIAFANAALARGIKNDTPEFFAYVEDQLGEAPTTEEAADEEIEEGDEEEIGADVEEEELDTRHANGEAARPQRPAAGTGSMAAPVARVAARGTGGGGGRRTPALNPEQREVALALYADLKINGKPASDADKLRHYAKNNDWAREYRPAHFRGAN